MMTREELVAELGDALVEVETHPGAAGVARYGLRVMQIHGELVRALVDERGGRQGLTECDGGGDAELRPEVRWFAGLMEQTLRTHDETMGDSWRDCTMKWIRLRLGDEYRELQRASDADFGAEAADLANFAMFGAWLASRVPQRPGGDQQGDSGFDPVWCAKGLALNMLIERLGLGPERAAILRSKVERGHRTFGDRTLAVGEARVAELLDLIGYGVFRVMQDGEVSDEERAFCERVVELWDVLDTMIAREADGNATE